MEGLHHDVMQCTQPHQLPSGLCSKGLAEKTRCSMCNEGVAECLVELGEALLYMCSEGTLLHVGRELARMCTELMVVSARLCVGTAVCVLMSGS